MRKNTQFHVRFTVPHVGAQSQVTSDVGSGGILLVAASSRDPKFSVPLVLVVDAEGLGCANPGVSATNAMATIVADWRDTVAEVLGRTPAELTWAQLDSEGCFDNVQPASSACHNVNWAPITAPGRAPRSAAAFCAAYPWLSDVVLKRVSAMTGVDLREAPPAMWGTV